MPLTHTGELPVKEYTCKENGSRILLSPIGIRFINLENENPENKNQDEEWLDTIGILLSTYFMTNDEEAVWLHDITTSASLQEKSSNNSDHSSIRIYEEERNLKRTADEMEEPYRSYKAE